MNEKTLELLAASLTADDTDIIPFLPYLLQDLWELGSSPSGMKQLLQNHAVPTAQTKVLDLACGKGAVAVKLAQQFGCSVHGIDIIPEFIDYAKEKVEEYGVADLCRFEVGDVVALIPTFTDYDVVIWGAAGNVMGTQDETLAILKKTVKPSGLIIMDDGYLEDPHASLKFEVAYPTFAQWEKIFADVGVSLVAYDTEDSVDSDDDRDCLAITKRAEELKQRFPDKATLFDEYVKNQVAEYEDLEGDYLVGVTWLLKTT